MTIKEQQVALAEAVGWSFATPFDSLSMKLEADMCWVAPGNQPHQTEHIPKYPTDLNLIATARKKLINTPKLRYTYCNKLREVLGRRPDIAKNKFDVPLVSDYDILNAEPEEHLETFVKTLGLWPK